MDMAIVRTRDFADGPQREVISVVQEESASIALTPFRDRWECGDTGDSVSSHWVICSGGTLYTVISAYTGDAIELGGITHKYLADIQQEHGIGIGYDYATHQYVIYDEVAEEVYHCE